MKSFAYAARPLMEDFFSTLVFVVLNALHVDVRIAVACAAGIGVAQLAWRLMLRLPVAALQWMSLGLVLVFGAASFFTHDPRFVMVKPSIIYVVIGCAMLQKGWMLRYMPPVAAGHGDAMMTAFGYVWAGLMFVSAIANAVVAIAYTAHWTAFVATFPLASKVALFLIQYAVVRMEVRKRIRSQMAMA
jgi:intracellular septation protein